MVPEEQTFHTNFVYCSREERARYTWLKYQSIMRGRRVLDVGADECHLKKWLEPGTVYTGIGRGGKPDMELDLESGCLPFPDRSFDTVLCLDVLEHLENMHAMFDELCRVALRHVILSLPNCLGFLWQVLTRFGGETENALMHHYGLPLEKPADRHRWFFDAVDAANFIRDRAGQNQMEVVQLDFMDSGSRPTRKRRVLMSLAAKILLDHRIDRQRLELGPAWAVLERKNG
jgi:hypothetical protein